jgi:hypothetical protein
MSRLARIPASASAVALFVAACGGDVTPAATAPPTANDAVSWPALTWDEPAPPAADDPAVGESLTAVAADDHGFVVVGVDMRGGSDDGTVRWSADARTWHRVGHREQFRNVSLVDVAAGPGGFVAIGTTTGAAESPHQALVVVFASDDGRTWVRRQAGLGDSRGYANAIAGGPEGYLVTADAAAGDISAWLSRDGETWQAIDPAAVPAGQPTSPVADPQRGGWMALGPNVGDPIAMHTLDGLTWSSSAMDAPDSTRAYDLAISSWGYLAVGGQGDCGPFSSCPEGPITWWSGDGLAWSRLPAEATPFDLGGLALGASSDRGFVAVRGSGAWSSPDGWTWTALPNPADEQSQVNDVVVLGDRIVAVGEIYRPDSSMDGRIMVAAPSE